MGDFATANGAVLNIINVTTGVESTASLVSRDADRDLAVLRIDSPTLGMRHFNRSSQNLIEGMQAHLVGFPNWSPGRTASVESTRVTSIFPKKGLKKFEVSSLIRKGNSGGPITSATFEVLGVAQEGATQETGNNEGLDVHELDQWLDGLPLSPSFDAE